MPERSGKIQTVLGLIEPQSLGVTLPHEHIMVDGSAWFIEPEEKMGRELSRQKVALSNLWWLRYHWLQNRDDLLFTSEGEAVSELGYFRQAGGSAVAEMSTVGLGRDPLALARISRQTGLHILMGCGYYLARSMPPDFGSKNEDDIAREIVRDIETGVADTGIRAGFIGEVGCSWPIDSREVTSLRAAVQAQQRTGAYLHVHPGPDDMSTLEILSLLIEIGADLTRTTMAHMERSGRAREIRMALLKNGLTIEYDFFGREGYYPLYLAQIDIPNDHQKIAEIMDLIDAGYIGQILVSQDIWNKQQRRTYGGWGYDHILRNAVPVMKAKGMTADQIRTIMVDNPRRLFTFI